VLLDQVATRVALVRTASWAPDDLRIVAVDVIDQREHIASPRLPDDRDAALDWVASRVEIVRRHAADGRPRAGADCQGCAFVAGCEAHA
jgi:hypothetical protein